MISFEIKELNFLYAEQFEINKEMTDVKLKYNKLLSAFNDQEETIKSLKQIKNLIKNMIGIKE